jgi:hypothetical protein
VAQKISEQTWGLDAALKREQENHPLDPTTGAWRKRTDTIKQTARAVNEHEDRLDAIEAVLEGLKSRPF